MLKPSPLSSALASSALTALMATFAFAIGAPACTSGSGGGGSGATPGSYCSLLSSYVTKCGITDACTLATVNDCSTLAGQFSSAYLDAITKCESNLACADSGAPAAADATCLQSALAAATPSAAQEKLAQDYCASCPTAASNLASCVAAFYHASSEGGLSSVSPVGAALLDYNDAIIGKVDATCTTGVDAGVLGCAFTFTGCAISIVTASVPSPPACVVDAG